MLAVAKATAVSGTKPHDAAPAGSVRSVAFPDGLTAREVKVLRLIAAGKSNREIAAELVISPSTVFHHIGKIFNKIGTSSRTEAAGYAHRHGLAG